MSFDYRKCEKGIRRALEGQYNLNIEVEDRGSYIASKCFIDLKGVGEDILLTVDVWSDATMDIDLMLDQVDVNARTLSMVNSFNDDNETFKAYLDPEDGYISVNNHSVCVDPSNVQDIICFVVDAMLDDDFIEPMGALNALAE